jgi:hypothetical protein
MMSLYRPIAQIVAFCINASPLFLEPEFVQSCLWMTGSGTTTPA